MSITFTKNRPSEYLPELKNEYIRLGIAKKSFTTVMSPKYFSLNGNSLVTSKVGAGSSEKFKELYSPNHFIDEYIKIIKLLWREQLKTDVDLVPTWVKDPEYKSKNNLHPDFECKTEKDLKEILSRKPILEQKGLTVVHGDLCPVNIIFNEFGQAIGVIDLGDMHIGDKMLDIAILSWTIRGNFGKKYEVLFLKRLNVDPEDKMLEYYRLIYNLNLPDYKNWDWIKE